MALGARIKEARESLGLDQASLCSRVPGLSQQALSNLETRDSKTSEFAIRIADALGVSIRWLLDGAGAADGCSAEAMELAAIYDRADARDRKLIRAMVLASESAAELPEEPMPPDDLLGVAPTPRPDPAR